MQKQLLHDRSQRVPVHQLHRIGDAAGAEPADVQHLPDAQFVTLQAVAGLQRVHVNFEVSLRNAVKGFFGFHHVHQRGIGFAPFPLGCIAHHGRIRQRNDYRLTVGDAFQIAQRRIECIQRIQFQAIVFGQ
ncbi:MAG: hypothetical protein D6816_03935 [Bacteroidetes bacterium]|nr:MAG: hypothetical protein D6816_03935 [Bacteroidota bacterium]